ncbi:MAG: oligosaccharide flippase family protein [Pelobacteraceae bacterium]
MYTKGDLELVSNNRNYISLFFSYGLSLLVVGLSYIYYSKKLSVAEFGLYSIALTIGAIGIFLLDGGLKIAIIKGDEQLSPRKQGVLLSWLFAISVVLSLLFLLIRYPLEYFIPSTSDDYLFLSLFAIVYLLSYPFIVIPTAFLERKLNYQRLAWVEATSIALERGLPVILLMRSSMGIYSFVIALVLGRSFRALAVCSAHPVRPCLPKRMELKDVAPLMVEGGWVQLATGFSLIRDNLHVLLIGPLYGKIWVGYYSWGLQLCMLLSQAFAQVSARISLPRMAQTNEPSHRWEICITQVRLLVILTFPLLPAAMIVLPGINNWLFAGKWEPVFALLPFLFARMVAGMAMTPVGVLVPVQSGGYVFARATILWTLMEIVAALLAIVCFGTRGLAISYSLMAYFGLVIYIKAIGILPASRTKELFRIIFFRPALLVSFGAFGLLFAYGKSAGIFYGLLPSWIVVVVLAIIIVSYASEKEIWRYILRTENS